MDIELINALNNISSNGLWAVFWYSFFNELSNLLLTIGIIVGIRALWYKISLAIDEQEKKHE